MNSRARNDEEPIVARRYEIHYLMDGSTTGNWLRWRGVDDRASYEEVAEHHASLVTSYPHSRFLIVEIVTATMQRSSVMIDSKDL